MHGKYEITPSSFNIRQTLKNLVNDYEATCSERNIAISLIDNLGTDVRSVRNDKSRIEQVLQILLDNSITAIESFQLLSSSNNSNKNSTRNSFIKISVSNSNKDPSCLTIEVDDSGSGVLDEFQPPFARPKTLQQSFHNCSVPIRLGLFNLNKIITRIGPKQELALKATKGIGTKISFKIFRNIVLKKRSDKQFDELSSIREKDDSFPMGNSVAASRQDEEQDKLQQREKPSIPTHNETVQTGQSELSNWIHSSSNATAAEIYSASRPKSQQHLKFRLAEATPSTCSNANNNSSSNNNNNSYIVNNTSGLTPSITCIDDSLKSEAIVSVSKKKLVFSTSQSSPNGSSSMNNTIRKQGRVKSVMIQEGALLTDASSPKANMVVGSGVSNTSDSSPKQKSILKRSKHTQAWQNYSDKCINLSEVSQRGNEQHELDGIFDEQLALQMEEFQDLPEKTPQFVARKTQQQKKLSHLSDFSRMLVPQNMPSTTVFSNSRLGNDFSPQFKQQVRTTTRNSTFNFTEISKDF